ncbi:MAG: ATP-dependent sacrificial sulfur transferase LarE [Acidimicrobiales bacterium]|nr:ATP-dependent sacrificial sulfur transferase LarE [Acidimicrobiales bacterium]
MVTLDALRRNLADHRSVVVAFSGGVDSGLLARVAHDTLGPERCLVVTAVSPSLAGDEHRECSRLAEEWGLNWMPVDTDEMERAAYLRNDGDRCYHCKSALLDAVGPLAVERAATVLLGVNVDDLGDHRPGQRAAAERGARFPLVEVGFTKAHIRDAARQLGLSIWDKPAAACLASRLPYGTEVSVTLLSQVDRVEAALHRLGFSALRVRHYGDTARIEVPLESLPDLLERRGAVVEAVKAGGYRYVTVDLEGLRSGNLNQALAGGAGVAGVAGGRR